MRKIAALILASAIIILLSACGTPDPQTETTQKQPPQSSNFTTSPQETTFEPIFSTSQTTPPETSEKPAATTEYVFTEYPYTEYLPRESNYLLLKEGLPEGLQLPLTDHLDPTYADVCFKLSDGEYFVTYLDLAFTGRRIHMICYTDNNGLTWDRMPRYCGEIIDFFAIDRRHFIFISDHIQMGYDIYVCENGTDVELAASSTCDDVYEDYAYFYHEYILPRAEFSAEYKDMADMLFYQAVTDFRLEPIDKNSCRIVLEYVLNGEERTCTAIYDADGIRPE